MSESKCPGCKAELKSEKDSDSFYEEYFCDSYIQEGGNFVESKQCLQNQNKQLRSQLEQEKEEIENEST